jgi:hypothetical protein
LYGPVDILYPVNPCENLDGLLVIPDDDDVFDDSESEDIYM